MRKIATLSAIAALSVPVLSAFAATSAHAEMLASKMNASMCVDLSSGSASLSQCNGSGGQNFFNTNAYGAQQYNGRCLQGTGSNQPLFLAACNGSQDQQWLLISGTGLYKNKGGWCANLRGGGAGPNTAVVSYSCDGSPPNERFMRGNRVNPSSLPPAQAAAAARAPAGSIIDSSGRVVGIISNDGASIVAQGGGNIVAQGGGNIVAQGGGN